MTNLALFPIIVCLSSPIIVNKTKEFSDYDKKALKRAKRVCKTRYKACLHKFTKHANKQYTAICYQPKD